MVGFGYIEVSVHHMELRPGLLLGAYRMGQGSPVFRASLRCAFGAISRSKACPAPLDLMRARLDWLSLLGQSGGHGGQKCGVSYCTLVALMIRYEHELHCPLY